MLKNHIPQHDRNDLQKQIKEIKLQIVDINKKRKTIANSINAPLLSKVVSRDIGCSL